MLVGWLGNLVCLLVTLIAWCGLRFSLVLRLIVFDGLLLFRFRVGVGLVLCWFGV